MLKLRVFPQLRLILYSLHTGRRSFIVLVHIYLTIFDCGTGRLTRVRYGMGPFRACSRCRLDRSNLIGSAVIVSVNRPIFWALRDYSIQRRGVL